ncbi:hypothetical protein C8A00DRAFT_43684 [Chaetomidium leptoderma]|uniref:SWIM-type domain-containing protein n=1 Tax=Chaetomidium leptoderma TaxID=669021 RepID=A0AAN6VKS8_9PEZI|nr:hypothetical protein C8A00DRAFT_43684 [Chaetomidium leptoderma]
MSLSPTTRMSRLFLECNAAVPIDQRRIPRSPSMADSEHSSDASDWDVEEDEGGGETNIVSSPTGFKYNISRLSPRTRQVVKGLFNQTSSNDPPQVSLELCGIREEDAEGTGLFYAFQMHEVVPCSVRIGTRDSQRFSAPKCECPDARYRHVRPCKHLIWLFDKISKLALFDHDPDSELTLTELGYAEELGDPFDQISQIGLDILADDLRCDTSEPDSDIVAPNSARVREAREMVAAVAGIRPCELDDYRPDLEVSYDRDTLIRRGDLGATLFSLILASHSLAEWVRSELGPSDPAADPFRSLQHRVTRVIQELDAYLEAQRDMAAADAYERRGRMGEGSRDVSWASGQIQHCVRKIEKLVSRGSNPLTEWARSSAARSLVSILKAVVRHRDLYARLIGDEDTNFVYSALDMLADQSQFVDTLEEIMDLIGVYGAPPSYVANMRRLIARMRSHKTEHVNAVSGSGVPRSDTPPLDEPSPGAVQHPGPSRSSSVQFLTPELPASTRGRGGQGRGGRGRGNGRGSKRPVSLSSPQDSSRGSKKRARGV